MPWVDGDKAVMAEEDGGEDGGGFRRPLFCMGWRGTMVG